MVLRSNRVAENIQNIRENRKLYECYGKLEGGINTEEQTFVEIKIQRGIFKGDSLSSRLFVIAMMPFNYVFRKCTGTGYKLTQSQEKIKLPLNIDDIKYSQKKKKKKRTRDTNNKNIQLGYRNGIWHRKMCHVDNQKWEKKISGRNWTTKQKSINTLGEEENLKNFGKYMGWHHYKNGY